MLKHMQAATAPKDDLARGGVNGALVQSVIAANCVSIECHIRISTRSVWSRPF